MKSSPATVPAIQAMALSKRFGYRVTLKNIDLVVNPGEFLTIYGPNGAGKTTLLRIVATLIKPTSGTVLVYGQDVRQQPTCVRQRIGVVSHTSYLYPDLTAYENLRFYARMYGVAEREDRIAQQLQRVRLVGRSHDLVRTFSRGMLQRLAIARALLHDPDLFLLDEPYTGLDQHASELLGDLLRRFSAEGRTIVMTTHGLEQGLALSHRVAILVGGQIAYESPREALSLSDLKAVYTTLVKDNSR